MFCGAFATPGQSKIDPHFMKWNDGTDDIADDDAICKINKKKKQKSASERKAQLFDPWTDHNCSCLTTESVEGLALSLESVDDVHSNNSLSLSMLSVGNSIPDHTLQVLLSSGLFVDESWFASHHLVERDVELWALWFPGCCLVRSFSDAWHLPFQVLYHLCLVQTSCCSFLLFNQN